MEQEHAEKFKIAAQELKNEKWDTTVDDYFNRNITQEPIKNSYRDVYTSKAEDLLNSNDPLNFYKATILLKILAVSTNISSKKTLDVFAKMCNFLAKIKLTENDRIGEI